MSRTLGFATFSGNSGKWTAWGSQRNGEGEPTAGPVRLVVLFVIHAENSAALRLFTLRIALAFARAGEKLHRTISDVP